MLKKVFDFPDLHIAGVKGQPEIPLMEFFYAFENIRYLRPDWVSQQTKQQTL